MSDFFPDVLGQAMLKKQLKLAKFILNNLDEYSLDINYQDEYSECWLGIDS